MNSAATVALAPLAGLYGAAMKARRALYQRGLLRVHETGIPVISIGNITTGGTGKTPLVEWIAGAPQPPGLYSHPRLRPRACRSTRNRLEPKRDPL